MILSSIISDGMVLQRNAKVTIGGKTGLYEAVEVTFLDKVYETKSDADGNWKIVLNELEPGGPHQMIIRSAEEETVIADILIGDVWVLGGQSNMELPVRRTLDLFANEINSVNMPFIRQFSVPQHYNFHAPQQQLSGGKWLAASPSDILSFSAAGFFFAKELYETYGVPIGLVATAVGGTPIEAWMSEATLRQIGGYDATLEQIKDDAYVAATKQKDEERNRLWFQDLNERDIGLKEGWHREHFDTTEWGNFELPNSWQDSELESVRGAVWFQKEIDVPDTMLDCEAQLMLGTIVDADDTYINGTSVGNTGYRYPPRRYVVPKGLLKRGLNTITVRVISTQSTGEFIKDMPYKLKANGHERSLEGTWKYRVGAITTAMESQTFFQYKPTGIYNSMIAPLSDYAIKGVAWYQGESNTNHPAGYNRLFKSLVQDWRNNWSIGDFPFIITQLANFDPSRSNGENWAILREQQRKGLEVPNTAMAVTIDIGEYNELHPQNKKTLGQRLALCAQKLAYGENIVYSGPLFNRMESIGDAIHLYFDHLGGGLTARGGELAGFMLCGQDGVFMPAHAVISGDIVIVTHEQIKQPCHVRYAWANDPTGANLYNIEGLPASPFTTQ